MPQVISTFALPNGWQLVQVWNLGLSIPRHKDKYYRAEITFRDGPSNVRAILNNPLQRSIDGSVVDMVYVLIDQQNIPAITRDAILKVEIIHELSQEEYEAIASEMKKMRARKETAESDSSAPV